MAKTKNYHRYGTVSEMNRLQEEYEFIGKYYVERPEPGHLVIHALPQNKEEKKTVDDNKRGGSSARKGSSGHQKTPSRDR